MFLFLLALWIIFNGAFTLEILLFGIGISASVCFFMVKFAGYNIKRELKAAKKLPFIIEYLFVLLIEIIKANIACSGLIIKGSKKIQPVVVSFSSPLKSEFLSTVLANSITLTPGTISVSMRNGQFTVHCLDSSLCDGIDSSSFVKILKRIEG
ncbi:MAG: Na+/H+ antiporter subunit E [Lachnospiraceae bacterium]|nr:Na+/H+ antiporter subunit E [Lachnospiraceae bacterium]